MALIEVNKNPSQRDLKTFALILMPLFTLIVGWLVYRGTESLIWAMPLWCFGIAVACLYFVARDAVKHLFVGWMYAAFPIGWLISHLVLAIVYYGVMTPIGLCMRLIGYDSMSRKLDPQASSYWKPYPQNNDPQRYFQQY